MTKIFGILNITDDSFSDGGKFNSTDLAVEQALKMEKEGADVIDIGAESTRPNAKTIEHNDEWSKIEPVLEALTKKLKIPISVDTRNFYTAARAIKNGAKIINDVSGLSDKFILHLVQEFECEAVFMHSLTVPANKKVTLPHDSDPIEELKIWLRKKEEQFKALGIKKEKMIFDPGIGFGKTSEQSLEIISRIEELKDLGFKILVGHSEKSFLTKFTDKPAGKRLEETILVSSFLATKKIDYVRVHNVFANKKSLEITQKLNFDCNEV